MRGTPHPQHAPSVSDVAPSRQQGLCYIFPQHSQLDKTLASDQEMADQILVFGHLDYKTWRKISSRSEKIKRCVQGDLLSSVGS